MPSGNTYNLQIGAILNTKDLEQTLKNEKAQLEKSDSTKIKWRLDTGQLTNAIKVVKQFNSEIGKIKQVKIFDATTGKELESNLTKVSEKLRTVEKETTSWNNGLGQLVTQVRTVDEAGQELITETVKYTNAQNQQIKTTRTLVEENGQLVQRGREVIETTQMLAESTTTTNQYFGKINDTINGVTKSYDGLITTTTKVNSNGETVITKVSEYITAAGQAVKVTETLNEKGDHIATTQRQISSATDKTNKSLKDFNNSANNATKSTNSLNWSLTDAFRRLANFYLASLPIRAFQTAITDAVEVVKDFDSAITEMGKVSDYSGDKLIQYTKKLADLGTEVARTQTEMTEAATGWLKAGYSEEDAALLSKFSALLQNTADEELSASEATSILVSQLKAYHMEAEEAIKVTDIINKVSANQAVSSGDIAKGLTVASAAMSTFGNSIEQTTALLTAGTTIFQGRSQQVARGLNMIATRVAKNEEELAKYGVSINDASGKLRSTYDILVDLAPAWNNMSKAEQVALGNTLAGTNQYKILAAIMSQMDVAIESYDQALNSSGETMKQNAVYMESLEAKTTALKAEFEQLVIGKGGLQDTAKWFVELGTSILSFINWAGGLPSILVTITSLLVGINSLKIYEWFSNLGKSISNIPTMLSKAANAWKSYALSMKVAQSSAASMGNAAMTLKTTLEASIPIIGIIVTTLGLLTSAIIAHNKHIEEQRQKIRDNISAFSEEYKALENTTSRLYDEGITREELNDIIDTNLDKYEAERLKLLDNNEAREETIRLIDEEKKARAQELIDTGLTAYEESLNNIKNGYVDVIEFTNDLANQETELGNTIRKALSESGLTTAKTLNEQEKALISFKNNILNLRDAQKEGSYEWTKYNVIIKDTESTLTSFYEKQKEDKKIVNDFNQALAITGQYYDESTGKIKKAYTALEEKRKGEERANATSKDTLDSIDDFIKKYDLEADAIADLMEQQELSYEEAVLLLAQEKQTIQTTEELTKAYEDALEVSNNLVSEISKVSSALSEQEKNGSIAVETQLELIEAGYGLALSYDKETGACKLNKEAVQKLVEAKLEMQIANLQIARSNIVNQLIEEANAATVAAGAFLELAKAKNVANEASLQNSVGRGYNASYEGWGNNAGYLAVESEKAKDQIDKLNGEISALENSLKGVKTSGVGAFKATGNSAKSAKGATDDLKKSVEDLKSQYEKVISYINKQYDRKISDLGKEKDSATKPIEDEIKALEKEKDAISDALQAEIDKREKQRDKYVDLVEEKIDAEEKERDTIIDSIEDKIDALEKERDALIESVDAKLDALEEEKDAILDNIEAETTALKEQKEERQKYWDAQIDALKKANDERKDAIELQEKLDALERARNTKVKIYKEGQGFVYDVDQTKVAEAQKALDEYLSQKAYEDELERLTNLKEAEMNNYSDRIDALNKFKDETSDAYQKQINDLKKYRTSLQLKVLSGRVLNQEE